MKISPDGGAGAGRGALHVRDLCAWYGQAQALFDVSFEARPGETVAVIGRNGAGKTTMLSAIARVIPEVKGSVSLAGVDISAVRSFQAALAGISLVRDGGRVFRSLTVRQNLAIGRRLAQQRQRAPLSVEQIVGRFPALAGREDVSADLLSGGQRQALAIGMALISAPTLLLLDEPSAGLAPPVVRELFQVIAGLAQEGIGVVLAEQNSDIIRGVADRTLVIESGVLTGQTQKQDHMEKGS